MSLRKTAQPTATPESFNSGLSLLQGLGLLAALGIVIVLAVMHFA
ncbi:hypothetical protein [Bordetella sp. FB-8]|nr:hypothetical protein [Bordetella sp. FB-8]